MIELTNLVKVEVEGKNFLATEVKDKLIDFTPAGSSVKHSVIARVKDILAGTVQQRKLSPTHDVTIIPLDDVEKNDAEQVVFTLKRAEKMKNDYLVGLCFDHLLGK